MIICALFNSGKPSTNLVKWLQNELFILEEKAIENDSYPAIIAAELGQWHCESFQLLDGVEPDQNIPYHSTDLTEWKLDYQKRAFVLFDFIRDRFRDEAKIDTKRWVEVDEKHTNAGYFKRREHFTKMLVLTKKLEELLNTTD